jgi:hypothetical protein
LVETEAKHVPGQSTVPGGSLTTRPRPETAIWSLFLRGSSASPLANEFPAICELRFRAARRGYGRTMATSPHSVARPAARAGERAVHSTAFEALSRAGLVARGVVYAIVAILALALAAGIGGKATDQEGALRTIAHQPFGRAVVAILAIGLGGYAVWKLGHALLGHGPEKEDSGFERLAALGSALVYAALCAFAVELLVHGPHQSSSSPEEATGGVLGWPGGTWLVALAGLAVIGIAAGQVYIGLKQTFLDNAKVDEMGSAVRRWYGWVGTCGYCARGVVFGLAGAFLVKAALEYDPKEAVGLDGALAKLASSPQGPALLGLVAAGLLAFAVLSFAEARYRRV